MPHPREGQERLTGWGGIVVGCPEDGIRRQKAPSSHKDQNGGGGGGAASTVNPIFKSLICGFRMAQSFWKLELLSSMSGCGSRLCPVPSAPPHTHTHRHTLRGSLSAANLSPSSALLSGVAHLYVGTERCIRNRTCPLALHVRSSGGCDWR